MFCSRICQFAFPVLPAVSDRIATPGVSVHDRGPLFAFPNDEDRRYPEHWMRCNKKWGGVFGRGFDSSHRFQISHLLQNLVLSGQHPEFQHIAAEWQLCLSWSSSTATVAPDLQLTY